MSNPRILLKTCLLVLILFPLAANTVAALPVEQAVSYQTLNSPEQVTHDFYKWYTHAINQGQDPIRQQQILSRYVTARLIREINRQIRANEYDVDYFIDGQNWDKDWEQNITVNAIKSTPNRPAFKVTLSGAGMPNYKLKVTLQKEAGIWKIDRVESLNYLTATLKR